MKQLSIVIVNYNVRHFLELTIDAALKASQNITAEIIVVDNASTDGSQVHITSKYPSVKYIYSNENLGFSKGNNLAIQQCNSEYILLLNPDTVIAEDCLEKCLQFMQVKPQCGALGVKMLDGSGRFLAESKRGLPTPQVAFYKLSGLSSIFPRSKTFSKYHAGHLSNNENHKIDVLAGAFMLLRKTALDKTGLLDETFFMYGEDIDLSYRIQQAGYENYYFSDSPIIHFKGESTKKTSVNYVRVFYSAMIIFARKHFGQNKMSLFSLMINIGIYAKAALAIIRNFLQSTYIILLDAALGWLALIALKNVWAVNVMQNPNHFPHGFTWFVLPMFLLVWLVVSFFSGVYDTPYKLPKIFRGVAVATILNAAVYGFLPAEYHFSRTMIALGGLCIFLVLTANRLLAGLVQGRNVLNGGKPVRIAIAGTENDVQVVLNMLNKNAGSFFYAGLISNNPGTGIGSLQNIRAVARALDLDEIIFCNKSVSYKQAISCMESVGGKLHYRFALTDSAVIIGSSNKNRNGEIDSSDIKPAIAWPANVRNKRVFDITMSLCFLFMLIPLLLLVKDRISFVKNIFLVLVGSKTWVGVANASLLAELKLQKAVIPVDTMYEPALGMLAAKHYAGNYSVYSDMRTLLSNLRNAGNE